MNVSSIKEICKKHYLLLSLTLVAVILLLWAGATKVWQPVLSTPIASIEPKDSSVRVAASSKLEAYLEELKPKHNYRAAREEVMAMDFSKPYQKPKMHTKPLGSQRKDSAELKAIEHPKVDNKSAVKPKELLSKSHTKTGKAVQDKSKNMPLIEDGFHTLKAETDTQETASANHHFVKAVIEGNQKLQAGAALRLRLKEEANWKGQTFARNTILHGTIGGSSNGRIKIRIVRIGEIPVSLSVFDQDLQEGLIYAVTEPVNDALKESSRDALNEVFYSLPYGGVAGGIARLGRSLFSKTSSRTKANIYLADGYELFVAPTQ
jgi:hypothetical protein